MARGDMKVENTALGSGTEILNRPPYEAVSVTIDFTNVTADANGEKVVKAGTPIDKDGKPVTATPWTGAIGILLIDVRESRPQGAVLREAYINTARAQENSGLTYDSALVTAMNNAGNTIKFEDPYIFGGISEDEPVSITLNKSTDTVAAGSTTTLIATVTPNGAIVTWESSDTSVATVSDGTVTGVSAGTATITATNGTASATCTVTVTA